MLDQSSRRDFIRQSTQAAVLFPAATWATGLLATGPVKQKLKIGQIGVGHAHAEGKMQALRNAPDWEVVGVVEKDPELRADAEQRDAYRGLPWLTDEQLLNTHGLKAVAVETQVDQLLDVAQKCVDAGLNIHLDKPPGSSLAQFKKVLDTADGQGLVVQMGYMYRYNPGIKLLRELLAKGWLGEIFEVNAVMSKVVNGPKRKLWAESPGGTMLELGSHLIDLLVGILGKPDKVTPYARHSGDFDDNLVDNMLAVCEYPRTLATIRSTALEVEGGERRHFVVCGTEGTLQIEPLDNPAARLALTKPRGKYQAGYQQIEFPEYERYVDDVADLAAIILGEKASDYDSAHDLAAQETLLKACGL